MIPMYFLFPVATSSSGPNAWSKCTMQNESAGRMVEGRKTSSRSWAKTTRISNGFETHDGTYFAATKQKVNNQSAVASIDLSVRNGICAFYVYDDHGSNRRENITDWSLAAFRKHYRDDRISKWDIFYYVYAVLHHPAYRRKYKANLKHELPRIPTAPDFWAFARIGKRLAEIHIDYEKQPEYELDRVENPEAKLSWRVEKMRFSKAKDCILYNDFLTLVGVPPEVFEYRLGNRSALEWVIDQYQVSIDKRSGITNDPNRSDDPEYIVRLIGQVITVSMETVKLIRSLPSCEEGGPSAAEAFLSAVEEDDAVPNSLEEAAPLAVTERKPGKSAKGADSAPKDEGKGSQKATKTSKTGNLPKKAKKYP